MKKLFQNKLFMTALLLFWMGLIFWFSAGDATVSNRQSSGVLQFLLSLSCVKSIMVEIEHVTGIALTTLVRKLAHLTEYAILGMLFIGWMRLFLSNKKRYIPYSFLAGVLYAVTDELHQLFVPGRACLFRDILIDSCGLACGIILLLLLKKVFWPEIKNKQ